MKKQTLERVYTKSIPTVVVWDSSYDDGKSSLPEGDECEVDQVWEDMKDADNDGDNDGEGGGHPDDELSTSSLHKKFRTR